MSRILVLILLINVICICTPVSLDQQKSIHRRAVFGVEPMNSNKHSDVEKVSITNATDKPDVIQIVSINLKSNNSKSEDKNVVRNETNAVGNVTNANDKNETSQNNVIIATKRQPAVDSEALLRGFYVFIGFSVITLMYVMYRSYRIRTGGDRPTTVRKYGILTQRTDMEMLPLPLDDDDDDDTVFDVGSHVNR